MQSVTFVFYLVLTFYGTPMGGPVVAASSIPGYFTTLEECGNAAVAAGHDYNGGLQVNWVCVGVPKNE